MASLAAVESSDGEQLLQGNIGTLKKISFVTAWGRWLLALASVLLIASSLLFAVVWLVRTYALSAKIPALSIRAWPAATSSCIVAAIVVVVIAQASAFERLGVLSVYSGGYWLLTLVYAAFALWSVANVWLNRDKRAQVTALVWWHSNAVVAANLVVFAYLGYYGMIGLRFWAY